MYDDYFDLEYEIDQAAEVLMTLARNENTPQPLKQQIFVELQKIAQMEAYSSYGIHDVDALILNYTMASE